MIAAVFITAPAFSSLTQNVVIGSKGIIVGSSVVNATSGYPADIQNAVNAVNAVGGGTVYIPAGTFHWNGETVNIPAGVNVIGASYAGCMSHEDNWQSYTATTILHNDKQPTSGSLMPTMFYVDGRNGRPTRISGIQFESTAPLNSNAESTTFYGAAIYLLQAKNFRIDHCTFIDFSNFNIEVSAYSTTVGASSYGLADHCVVDSPYKETDDPLGVGWQDGYGFDVLGNMRSNLGNWVGGIRNYAGKYEAIPDCALLIVEDCHFSRCRHATDGANGGFIVPRYCLFDEPAEYQHTNSNIGDISIHGGGWGTMTPAFIEAYNNVGKSKTGTTTFGTTLCRIRGGSGIFYNNQFLCDYPGSYAQVFIWLGQDSEVPEYAITQTYIWDNNLANCTFISNHTADPVLAEENVDYFLRAPTLAQDGWSYVPYPYPHPLVGD
jgi:hypothetical protein